MPRGSSLPNKHRWLQALVQPTVMSFFSTISLGQRVLGAPFTFTSTWTRGAMCASPEHQQLLLLQMGNGMGREEGNHCSILVFFILARALQQTRAVQKNKWVPCKFLKSFLTYHFSLILWCVYSNGGCIQ